MKSIRPCGPPGGINALIQSTPAVEAWLRWITQASTEQTCGALEELQFDRVITQEADPIAFPADGQCQTPPLLLFDANANPVIPLTHSTSSIRFPLKAAGPYRLLTSDRALLWSQDLTHLWNTPYPETWHLAAAPETPDPAESPGDVGQTDDSAHHPITLIRRSHLPQWRLILELHRDGDTRWLTVIDLEKGMP